MMDDKLDISFAIDCTSSMDSYIDSVKQNIENWTQQILMPDIGRVRVGLVEYRDHPPDTYSFVTRKHDFTHSASTLKTWLSSCSTDEGDDVPEAVEDALNDVLHLSWRSDATKICILICDAPPHGLSLDHEDKIMHCPNDHDPVTITSKMAKTGIALYVIGFALTDRVANFFMALAFKTGGQYIPLCNAEMLGEVIQGGIKEERSLEEFMSEVNEEVWKKKKDLEEVRKNLKEVRKNLEEVRKNLEDQQRNEMIIIEELSRWTHEKMKLKKARATQMIYRKQVGKINRRAKMISRSQTLPEMRESAERPYVPDPNKEEAGEFGIVEGDITIEQCERMVIKAVARLT